jgi:translocation and assembly module TamB
LEGYAKGKLDDLEYKFRFSLSGGELKYFNKKFYVKSGFFEFDKKSKNIDLTIASSLPDYVILIDLKGDPEYPKVLLSSEPPRETRKIITDLLLGWRRSSGNYIPRRCPILSDPTDRKHHKRLRKNVGH